MTYTVSCVGLDQPTIVDMSSGNTAVNFSGLTIPVVTHVFHCEGAVGPLSTRLVDALCCVVFMSLLYTSILIYMFLRSMSHNP